MKFLLVVTLTLAVVSAQTGDNDDQWVAGQLSRAVRAVFENFVDPASTCRSAANSAKYCSSTPGCSNARYFQCFNGYSLPAKSCPEYAKYCSGGACVSVPPSACKPEFICPYAGNFPKYNDCSSYYYCAFDERTNDFIYSLKTCPIGYAFNPLGPQEKLCLKGGACVTASCNEGKTAEWRPLNYPGFTQNQIALYCSNGQPVNLDACSNGQSIDINNVASRSCSVKCLTDYQIAVFDGDYKCYLNCIDGYSYIEECEYGEVFDPKTLKCVTSPNRVLTTTMMPGLD